MRAQWKHKGRLAAADAKGRIFTKLAKEIMIAARGGADVEMNSRLRLAVEAAKKQSMPRDTLERAIKKGAGLLDEQVTYETVIYEGFAPHQVPVIVECLTDNKNRTATNVRMLFRKGQLASSGAVSWDFSHVGIVEASPPATTGAGAAAAPIDAETIAIEAGAQDVESAHGGAGDEEPHPEIAFRFFTDATDVDKVHRALSRMGWTVTVAELGWRPKNPVTLAADARTEVEAFLEAIHADDDVQHLYAALAD
jgi:YebC/PmpR family DNA-binding regulatory protein